jgi:hypothetical protein
MDYLRILLTCAAAPSENALVYYIHAIPSACLSSFQQQCTVIYVRLLTPEHFFSSNRAAHAGSLMPSGHSKTGSAASTRVFFDEEFHADWDAFAMSVRRNFWHVRASVSMSAGLK